MIGNAMLLLSLRITVLVTLFLQSWKIGILFQWESWNLQNQMRELFLDNSSCWKYCICYSSCLVDTFPYSITSSNSNLRDMSGCLKKKPMEWYRETSCITSCFRCAERRIWAVRIWLFFPGYSYSCAVTFVSKLSQN